METSRSQCPINLSVEALGDRWTLLILRDMIFGNKRHFRELLQSEEHISSNILADRLEMLLREGFITRSRDPSHAQKVIYSLTDKSIALLPIFVQLGAWGRRYLPVSEELSIRAELLEKGGSAMWSRFMEELRDTHLTVSAPRHPGRNRIPVRERLQIAYERVVAMKGQT
jgi:DNA-binding HxlR family transcriptional regulator